MAAIESEFGRAVEGKVKRKRNAAGKLRSKAARVANGSSEVMVKVTSYKPKQKPAVSTFKSLIKGRNHCLGDVGKEVIDAEACAGEWIHPVVQQQTAHDELEKEMS